MKIDTTKALQLGIPFTVFLIGTITSFIVGINYSGGLALLMFIASVVVALLLMRILEEIIQ